MFCVELFRKLSANGFGDWNKNVQGGKFSFNLIPDLRVMHLGRIFETISEYGLKINFANFQTMLEEVNFLGLFINKNGFRLQTAKAEVVIQFTCASEVKSLLGMASFSRNFFSKFSNQGLCLILSRIHWCKSPYPVQMRENADQKKLSIWTFPRSENVKI